MTVQLEPLRTDDADHRSVYNATFNGIWPEWSMTDTEFAHELEVAGPGLWWIAHEDGVPVGTVAVERATWNADDVPPLTFAALPEQLTDPERYLAMLRPTAEFARAQGFTELRVHQMDRETVLGELLGSLDGWAVTERNIVVGVDLTKPNAAHRDFPDGVRLTTLAAEPDLLRSTHACQSVSVGDVPGDTHVTPAFDAWLTERDAPYIPDEAAFLAVGHGEDGPDTVLAFSQLLTYEATPEWATHDYTASRPEARGRGLAFALKVAAIDWAREQGYQQLRTENEERNEPIRHINQLLGYEPVAEWITHRGPVAALLD